ncbi:MAG TPA: ATPase, T2SS/T4P/T4SS family [Candidatus Omnitrophota bacterium]|nr:ATPase, T2SS/T4P/T4SS family [Candidatus Omnitrophota bacterium]HRZ14475.1 ATPase, T2SS/T4P/T4SS family [Candidatus Omnitrophota bacterium]
MNKIDSVIFQSLAGSNLVPRDSLDRYVKESEQTGQTLVSLLLQHALLTEHEFLDILSEKLKIPRLDLKHIPIDKSLIDKIPSKIAHYYKFFPVKVIDRTLTLAVSQPLDIKTQDEIRTQLGFDVEMVLSASADISEQQRKHYGFAADTLGKMNSATGQEQQSSDQDAAGPEKVEDIEKLAEDASVIQLVNQLILEAFRKRATDIHIEPYRDAVSMRYRIDGILYDANVPVDIRNYISAIISRIKIMSNLNIVERRLPQDGRAVVKVGEQVLDLRISTIPTPFGESVVIRILPTKMLFNLEKLGLSQRDLLLFEEMLSKPHGIIFVTGPTGSGKTTTLYACLSKLNTKDRKIITIEDPIEYEMSGITQIQVMPEIGLDFSRGLRSILRHDPDVIMVGEVRDLETAEIAIRVALTGHLVFSTLHTNDAASGITRLVDIGLEPYLVSSSVESFIAQRLIRLICPACKQEDKECPRELKELIARESGLSSSAGVRTFRGTGCPNCNGTGFLGRTAIYEILMVNQTIKDMIVKKCPSNVIKNSAVSSGMRTLRQDGWQKVLAGLTTPEEVMKVSPLEEQVNPAASDQMYVPQMVAAGTPAAEGEANKRIYKRLQSRVNVRYVIFKTPDDFTRRGLNAETLSATKNIGAGGLLFMAKERLTVGDILEMKIELPNGQGPVDCLSRVVRVEEMEGQDVYDIAVCFLDLTGGQRNRLEHYVEARSEQG